MTWTSRLADDPCWCLDLQRAVMAPSGDWNEGRACHVLVLAAALRSSSRAPFGHKRLSRAGLLSYWASRADEPRRPCFFVICRSSHHRFMACLPHANVNASPAVTIGQDDCSRVLTGGGSGGSMTVNI
jgi:hypothetical protein